MSTQRLIPVKKKNNVTNKLEWSEPSQEHANITNIHKSSGTANLVFSLSTILQPPPFTFP